MKLATCVQTDEVPVVVPVALLEGSLAQKVEKAARLGFDGLELMTTDPMSLDVKAIRVQIESAGLQIAAVGTGALAFALGLTLLSPDPAVRQEAETRLDDLIDFAGQVGAPIVTIGSFRGRLAWGGASAFTHITNVLRSAAAYAMDRNVRLAIEPLNRHETDLVNTAAQGLALVKTINHPALGLLLDTYHVDLEESSWTDPFEHLLGLGLLWHIHVGDKTRLPPRRGLVDLRAIVETLQSNGYEGYLSAELLAGADPDEAARETFEALRSLMGGSECD